VVARFGSNDAGPGDFTRASDPFLTPNALVMPTGARRNYHPAYDRSAAAPGSDIWDLGPPNGTVDVEGGKSIVGRFNADMKKAFGEADRFFPISYKKDWEVIREIAEATGETIDRGRHALLADVKAVTLYRLAVEESTEGWRAVVVLDV